MTVGQDQAHRSEKEQPPRIPVRRGAEDLEVMLLTHKKYTSHWVRSQDKVKRRLKYANVWIEFFTNLIVLVTVLAELIHKI